MGNILEKTGGRGYTYDGRIFTEEELKLLSEDTRRIYEGLLKNDYTITPLRQYDLDNVLKIISEIAEQLRMTTSVNNFWFESKMTAFNVKMLNDIIMARNNIVDGKKWDQLKIGGYFENLNTSLDFLINNSQIYHLSYGGGMGQIDQVNKVVKKQAEQIKATICRDIVALPQYVSQYRQALAKYEEEKAKWERIGRLGQLIGRLTGKDRQYNEARHQVVSYNNTSLLGIGETISLNGKTMEANRVENRDDDYLFVKPTIPANYENIEPQEQSRMGR